MRIGDELVHDYHVAREAQQQRLEAASGTRAGPADPDVAASRFYAATGATDLGGETPLTWKAWVKQARPPKPSPEEVQTVHAVLLSDSDERLKEAMQLVSERAAIRDMEIFDAWEAGMTLDQIAFQLGTSRQAIHKVVKRYRGRQAS